MISFIECCDLVLSLEGGYWDDPVGGPTNFGISQRAYPKLDIKNLTVDKARAIYLSDYWKPIKADKMPHIWRLPCFDSAINHGVAGTSKMVQKVMGVTADGKIGAITLRTMTAASEDHLVRFLRARLSLYQAQREWGVNRDGWESRLFKVALYAR